MIKSHLRRTALVAAAIASLSVHADAHGDAALSIALGAMHAPLATIAQLQTVSQKPPAAPGQTQAPSVSKDVLIKILDAIEDKGDFNHEANGFIMRKRKSQVYHSATKYDLHEITIYSVIKQDLLEYRLLLQVADLEATIEADGKSTYDLWVFDIDLSGRLVEAVLRKTIRDIDQAPVTLSLTDPKVKTRFDAMILRWAPR